ncbi:MAG: ATP-binding protein [Myxococcota bacterium]
MPQVSCRATAAMLEVLAGWGIDTDAIERSAPLRSTRLRDPRARVDWDTFSHLLDRVASALDGEDSRLEALGEAMVERSAYAAPGVAAGRFLTPLALTRAASLAGSAAFPTIEFSQRVFDDGRFELQLALPEHARSARPFFVVTVGCYRAMPRRLGLADARVQAEVGPRSGHYLVTLPVDRGWSLRHGLAALWGTPAWLREVYASRRQLREDYAAMERWRRDFHRVLDHLPDAVLIHRDGVVRYANEALARVIGDPAASLRGHRVDQLIPWARFMQAREAVRTARDDTSARRIEIRRRRRPRILAVRLVEEVEFEGVAAELVVAQDVTDRVRMEERLRHTDRMATLGTLAAGIAHEINNPLGYLLNSLQILQRDAAEIHPGGTVDASWLERLRAMLEVALEGTDRVRTVLDDLRAFVRREDDAASPVDVREAIEHGLESLGEDLGDIVVERVGFERAQMVMAPSTRLNQVLFHVLLNAVQAMRERMPGSNGENRPSGSNAKTMRRAQGRLVVRVMREGGQAVIEVSDDGPGMRPEVLAQAFELFFTTKPAGVARGLGLPICRELVHRLGGTIDIESTAPRGTRVRVVLPSPMSVTEDEGRPRSDTPVQAARP